MEVHHHSHTGNPTGHKRKNWTHYFWEFLMLFLAVFCGFLAENIREHKIEHNRAHEFSKALVTDLENDIVSINDQIKSSGVYIACADSLLVLGSQNLEGSNAGKFSFYTRFMYWTAPVNWHRATFDQVKNSGSLRYFKNYALLDKLMRYDAAINNIQSEFNNHMIRGNMLLNSINTIIDPAVHNQLSKYYIWNVDTMSLATKETLCSLAMSSLENKRPDINEFLNMVVVQLRNLQNGITSSLPEAIEIARELIAELKKEYHL